jgi:hypothetical protein
VTHATIRIWLLLIKAIRQAGGRPVVEDHAKNVREGFVERIEPDEVVVERSDAYGYRRIGVIVVRFGN